MADLKKVISGQLPALGISNRMPPPEGDKPVFYSKMGSLELAQPPILFSQVATNCTSLAVAKAAGGGILYGSYFDASIQLDASIVTPLVSLIYFQPTAARSLQLPDAATLVAYLQSLFGAENVVANIVYQIQILNASAGANTVTITAGANAFVFGGTTGALGAIGQNTGVTLNMRISSVTPGSCQYLAYLV